MNNNGCIIPEIDEQNIGVQQENATFLVIGDEAYTSEIIEEYNRNAAAKTEEFNTNATNKTNDFNKNYDNKIKAFNSNVVTKTEDFDSYVTAQTTNFNNNAETATANFNRNAVQQTDEFNRNAMSYSQGIEENKKNIASTSNELYRLKTDVLETGESSGNNIHLEDSAWAEMQEIKVDGVLQQETTTGKNFLNMNGRVDWGGTIVQYIDTQIIINKSSTGGIGINPHTNTIPYVAKVGDEFTFSMNYLSGIINLDDVEDIWRFVVYGVLEDGSTNTNNNWTIMINRTQSKPNAKITFIANANYIGFKIGCYIPSSTNTTNGDVIFNCQLEKGSTATSYEPYTGGQPSPNPDYPQEIKTITDSLSVTSCNKNVFKITSPLKHFIASGVDISINDNVITLNGTAAGAIWPDFIWGIQSNTVIHNKCKYYFSRQLEDYTATINILSGTASGGSFVVTANDDSSSSFAFDFNNLQGSITHKANGVNRAFLSGITSGTKFDNFTFEIMLEKGSVATAFERRVESQIQAKLPEGEFIGKLDETHKDTLRAEYFPEEGQYHLMLDKMVGMGDTSKHFGNVKRISTKQNNYRFTFDINTDKIPILNTESSVIYPLCCNKFIKGSRETTFSEINSISYGISTSSYSQFMLYYSEIKDFTIAQFSDWLTNNPLIIYYILQKPYTLDLGVIDMPLTYDEITNIFTDSDLLPTINVKYYRNFTATIQNLQVNNDTLKNELSNIESRLTALESANTNIESRLATLENANKNVADSNPTGESEVTE